MSDNTTKQGAKLDNMSSDEKLTAILNELNKYDVRFNTIEQRFNMIDQQFSLINSRIGELEKNVRDISSIKGAVDRMGVGFQEIPYQMNGNSAVERIKDYY